MHGFEKRCGNCNAWQNCFEMAIMANRYDPFICAVTSLAIYLSCTSFGPGANMVFPGNSKSTRYGDALSTFLKRDDVKQSIEEYAQLLLGSHSTRKGATNAGAQGGLVAGVLMAVLLRGQWDIGDTLKRYFKEHNEEERKIKQPIINYISIHFKKNTSTRRIESAIGRWF